MKKTYIYLVMLFTVMASCKKEKALNVDITKTNLDTYEKGELDKWLETNFLDPYNMEILYRFDRYQTKIDKEVAPVMADRVQPIMEGVDQIFIKPYLEITSKSFLLPLLPKEIALFGSGEYSDDQITLGTADAGRQINLYEVNSYDQSDYLSVMGTQERPAAFHTMHHEFTHILNQNIPVPPGYEDISPNYVGSAWVGAANPTSTARNLGFVTRYARNNKNEDFAEMTASLLVGGQDEFEAYLNKATDPTAFTKLRKKEQMVVDYFKSAFGIDFRTLQAQVRTSIETYAPVTKVPVINRLSQGSFKGFTINKNAAGQSAEFVKAYNTANTQVSSTYPFSINSTCELVFTNVATNRVNMILKFTGATYSFWYNLTAEITNGTSGKLVLSRAQQGPEAAYGNGTLIEKAMKPLLDYFTAQDFSVDRVEDMFPGSRYTLLGFFNNTSGQLGFYGTIQKN